MTEGKYAIEVLTADGWVRMRHRYRTKECAKSWVKFVKLSWLATKGRVVKVMEPVAAK